MHSARAIPDPKFLLLLCHTPGNLSLLVPALGTLKSTGFPHMYTGTSPLQVPLMHESSLFYHLGGLESLDHWTVSP